MVTGLLSIIIVNYNSPHLIAACLKSIDKYLKNINKEILVIDNNSTNHDLDLQLGIYPSLKVFYLPVNMGFGYANNIGVRNSNGDVLLILNSDTEFIDTSFKEMYYLFRKTKSHEIWGPRLVWPNGDFQLSYSKNVDLSTFILNYTSLHRFFKDRPFINEHKYNNAEFKEITEVDIIYGTALLIRKDSYTSIYGFSSRYFMYFEDLDLCDKFKNKLGGKVNFYPFTTIIHQVKGSSKESSIGFNYKFNKSKYIYGVNKFGIILISIILLFDLFFEIAYLIKKKLTN